MLRGLLGIGFVCGMASCGLAFGHAAGSVNAAPTQQLVRIDTSGSMQVYYQAMKCIPETQTRTITEKIPVTEEYSEEVDGQVVKKQRTVYKDVQKQIAFTVMRTVWETQARKANLDKVKAFETDGKAISPKKLKERLTEDTLVVVSGNDKMIPDYYATVFRPGTVILSFEREPVSAPLPITQPPVPIAPPAEGFDKAAPKPNSAGLAAPVIRFVSQEQEEDEENVELRVPDSAPGPKFPKTMSPLFAFASREGAEQYKIRQTTENSFVTTGYKVKRQGTGKQMVPVKMRQTVRHTEFVTIDGKDVQFFTGEGGLLPVDRVKEKLSREATVLYSADGEPVDPFWLQNLKSAALVIVGPQLPGGCGAMPSYGGGYPIQAMPAPAPPAQAVPAPAPPPAPGENPQPSGDEG